MRNINRYIIYVCVWIGCLIPLTTRADRVEGVVSPIPSTQIFVVLNKDGETYKTVKVNDKGEFTVYLPPGLYRVKSTDGKSTLRSEAMPMRNQQITFKK